MDVWEILLSLFCVVKPIPSAMSKSLYFKVLTLSVLLLCGMVSCSQSEIPSDPHKRILSVTIGPTGDILIGETAVFEIHAQDFASTNHEVYCTFDETEVVCRINSVSVASGHRMSMPVDGRTIRIEAIPQVAGDIKISLWVADGSSRVSQVLTLSGVDKVYRVELQNTPSPMYPGLRRSIDLLITDPEKPDLIAVDYTVSAKVIKGKGVVHILDEMVWNDTLPDFAPCASVVKNAKWAMMYTGLEVGENQIKFTVQDAEGRESSSVQTIQIAPSEFEIDTVQKTPTPVIERNERYLVHFFIDDKGNYTNHFVARCHFTKGKGSIGVSQDVLSEEPTELKPFNRSQLCQIEPETEGEIEAVIEIHDLYGAVQSQKVAFSVNGDDYAITCNFDGNQYTHVAKPFEINLSGSKDPANQYQLKAELIEGPAGKASLKLNGTELLGLTEAQDILAHETMYVRFDQPGNYKFRLTFSDKWADPKEQYVTFIVTDNPLNVTLSRESDRVQLGSSKDYAQWQSQMSVPKEDAGIWEGATLHFISNTGKGTLMVDNAELASGSSCSMANKTTAFYYTPTVVGQHNLTFLFSLADGRTVTKVFPIEVSYSDISANLSCATTTLYDNEEREISIFTEHPGYDGKMKYKFEWIAGHGKIIAATGTELTANKSYPLDQKTTERMKYVVTDSYTGPVEIRYTIIGGGDMEVSKTVKFNVEPALRIFLRAPSTMRMGTAEEITVSIQKKDYTGNFGITYELQQPYPIYVGKGTIAGMTDGIPSIVTGNSQTLVFTPTEAGQTQLRITVSDDTGKTVSETITFYIALLPLEVNPSPINAPVFHGMKPTEIILTIPDENPEGEYKVSYVPTHDANPDDYPIDQKYACLMYLETDNGVSWGQRTQRTLKRGSYKVDFLLENESKYIHLHFTLVGPNGTTVITTVKVINTSYRE